jgi:IclR family acetate operon transcriptional repressor
LAKIGEIVEPEDPSAYSIRAVRRVCDLLDLLQDRVDGVSLPEVAEAVRLPKSSAFRYLATLESRRYVERTTNGDYRLGLAFLPIQAAQLDTLADRGRPLLEVLRDEFEETVNLGLLSGNRVSYIEILESPKAMRLAARKGDRDPIHSTALGKAIAAHLDPERVRAILDVEGMQRYTKRTVTSQKAYFAELERVRNDGYAVDDGENEPDGRCLAVPLFVHKLPAAISLSAPAARFPIEDVASAAARLTEVAQQLSRELDDLPDRRPDELAITE